MPTFLHDTFTDDDSTPLTDHTGEIGATWTTHPADSGDYTITGNAAWVSTEGWVLADAVPDGTTYTISGEIICRESYNTGRPVVVAYADPDEITGYAVTYVSRRWRLHRVVAGTWTQLAQGVDDAPGDDTVLSFTFTVAPGSQRLEAERGSGATEVLTASDTEISGPGRVALGHWTPSNDGVATGTTGTHLLDLTAATPTTPVVDVGAPTDTATTGQAWTRNGSFADDDSESWTATVDYDDSAGPEALTLNPDKTFTLSHAWASTGTYNVVVTVEDDDGLVGDDTVTVSVNDAPIIGHYVIADVTGTDAGAPVITLGGGA